MTWWSTVPLAIVVSAVIFLPGLLVGLACRLRGMALFAISPLISVTLISVAAILAPFTGLKWSPLPVIGLAVLMALAAFFVVFFLKKRLEPSRAVPWHWKKGVLHVLALAIATVLIARRLVFVFGKPDSFSQTFDNVFHLNAIRYILDTGSGSSMDVSGMTGGGFYPSAWHDLVSLSVGIFGGSIPASVNLTNIIVGAVVWPLGCMFLAHQILGRRPAVSLAAGVLSAGFGAFPILLLDFGVLYPNFLGNALLPAALGLMIQALGLAKDRDVPKLITWLLFIVVLPGIALSHPSSLMALLALSIPALLFLWGKAIRPRLRGPRSNWPMLIVLIIALVVGALVAYLLWKNVRPPEIAAFWPPVESSARAIGEVIASAGINRPVSWIIMILAVLGIFSLALRRRQFWLLGMYLVIGALFVIVASFQFGQVRTFFTGVWYNDPPRLASLLPLVIVPIATIGAIRIWDFCKARILGFWAARNSPERRAETILWPRAISFILVSVVLLGGLIWGTQRENVREASLAAVPGYQLSPQSPLVSSDEMALIERLDKNVPKDAVLAGNPWNGSALAYAFADRKTLQLHILSTVPNGAPEIYDHLKDAKIDADVCPAVRELKVAYVLDFGHREVHGGDNGYKGLDDLVASGVATLVDSQGDAKLYKISAC